LIPALADPQKKRALIAGATGLVGGYVLRRLLAHPSYSRVEILVRRESPIRKDAKINTRRNAITPENRHR